MIKLMSFDNLERVLDRMYGGATGSKISVKLNDNVYMLKSQQNLKNKDFNNVEISYANDVVSEHIGSNIYRILGLPVHETILGLYNDKLSILCSDKAYPSRLFEFRELRNSLMNEDIIQHSSGMSSNIEDIFQVVSQFKYFDKDKVLQRFYDMLIIDALIGNTDRNNGNWGFLFNGSEFILYDVYDCGGCLSNKRSDIQMENDLSDNNRINNLSINYTSLLCEKGKRINPFKYIERNLHNKYIQNSLTLIDGDKLQDIVELINSLNDLISETRSQWYKTILAIRFRKLLELRKMSIKFRDNPLLSALPKS